LKQAYNIMIAVFANEINLSDTPIEIYDYRVLEL